MASLWIPPFDLPTGTVRRLGNPRLPALALAMVLFAAVGPLAASGSAAGQTSTGSGPRLEVRAWLCPTGIAREDFDFAADCVDPIAGATFTYSPPVGAGFPPEGQDSVESQTTEDDAVATWDALFDDGPFTLEQDSAVLADLGLEIVDYVVRCTVDGTEANLIENTCPDPAAGVSLPVSFGPSGGEETYTADDAGTLTFEIPAPSTALFVETGVAYVRCRDDADEELAEDAPPTWMRAEPPFHSFDVIADGELSCDWYLPPE